MANAASQTCVAYAYAPDQRFQKLLGGVSLREFFTPDRMEDAQQVMNRARDDFFELLQPAVGQVRAALNDASGRMKNSSTDFSAMTAALGTIRDQARVLHFTFILQITEHLLNHCGFDTQSARSHALIVQLVEALERAFQERIQDKGGQTGRNILTSLHQNKKRQA